MMRQQWAERLRTAVAATVTTMSLSCLLALGPAQAAELPTLTAAISADVATMDPDRILGAQDHLAISNIYESLYGHDEKGNLVPALATKVEVRDDGLTYEFTLRDGVKFHNGDPFTAEDVRFSWMRAVDPAMHYPRASILVANIADVEIVNPLLVRIRLKRRDAALLENLGENWFMVPKNHIEEVGDKTCRWRRESAYIWRGRSFEPLSGTTATLLMGRWRSVGDALGRAFATRASGWGRT